MTPALWIFAGMAFVALCWCVSEYRSINRPLTEREKERIKQDADALLRAADYEVATRPRVPAITEPIYRRRQ
jgi:hypothetical protein